MSPSPMAWPFIAAITGLRICQAVGATGQAEKAGLSLRSNTSLPELKSAPAQNAGGVPVSTTTRMASSMSARS